MSADLLPCPFCGGKPHGPKKSSSSDERSGYNFTISINCSSCAATIIKGSHQNRGGWCDDTGQALAEAIAAWNRRAAMQALVDQSQELGLYDRSQEGGNV